MSGFYLRAWCYLAGTAGCLACVWAGADPAMLAPAAAIIALPVLLRDEPAPSIFESEPPTQTVESKLRADLDAGRIDTLDFALAVDALPDLDAPAPLVSDRDSQTIHEIVAHDGRNCDCGVSRDTPGARWQTTTRQWVVTGPDGEREEIVSWGG